MMNKEEIQKQLKKPSANLSMYKISNRLHIPF